MSSRDTQPSRATIVNQLTLKLVAIGLFAAIINGIAAIASGPIGIVLLVLGNVAVLWLIVDAVFAALDELLELKLRSRE
ncbi:hypothetical protein RBH26_17905 [Natronolimnohabitans sp. A-GB9]|uniref:hypothetical protein n=1 Tax=Natronolimnohabitans sp. A-GB9 TaxID=3069757 RepID=UPI0027B1A35E|nr:hypothetical protein [Natronolimnohabitans sp. A-GB9]MDQ2052345.1 hypothetical protein [Natronolimnohabitans sp. A-GB9]